MDAMQRTIAISDNAGLVGMLVDAKDEDASTYYRRYGFTALDVKPLQLFLPMGTIHQAFT
jgi:hypothetical protein